MVKLLYQKVAKAGVTVSCLWGTEVKKAFENLFRNVNVVLDLSEVVEWSTKASSDGKE